MLGQSKYCSSAVVAATWAWARLSTEGSHAPEIIGSGETWGRRCLLIFTHPFWSLPTSTLIIASYVTPDSYGTLKPANNATAPAGTSPMSRTKTYRVRSTLLPPPLPRGLRSDSTLPTRPSSLPLFPPHTNTRTRIHCHSMSINATSNLCPQHPIANARQPFPFSPHAHTHLLCFARD